MGQGTTGTDISWWLGWRGGRRLLPTRVPGLDAGLAVEGAGQHTEGRAAARRRDTNYHQLEPGWSSNKPRGRRSDWSPEMAPIDDGGDSRPEDTGTSPPKEWGVETYRLALESPVYMEKLPPCGACGQKAWRGNGTSKNGRIYHLRCGGKTPQGEKPECWKVANASHFEEAMVAAIEDARQNGGELAQYSLEPPAKKKPRAAPKRTKNILGNPQWVSDEDTPGPHEGNRALEEMVRSLQEAVKALQDKISAQDAEIKALRKLTHPALGEQEKPMAPKTFAEAAAAAANASQREAKKTVGPPKGGKPVTKPGASSAKAGPQKPAGDGPTPMETPWITVGAAKAPSPQKGETAPRPKKGAKKLSEEAFERMLRGEQPKPRGLKWVYLRGLARSPLGNVRAFMAKLGIQNHWIKHVGFTDKGLLEVLIFAEHAEKIGEALEKAGSSALSVVEDPELYPEDATLLKKLIKRMERGVLRLHEDAHCTRRELLRVKQTALGKLAAAKGAAQMAAEGPEGQHGGEHQLVDGMAQ